VESEEELEQAGAPAAPGRVVVVDPEVQRAVQEEMAATALPV